MAVMLDKGLDIEWSYGMRVLLDFGISWEVNTKGLQGTSLLKRQYSGELWNVLQASKRGYPVSLPRVSGRTLSMAACWFRGGTVKAGSTWAMSRFVATSVPYLKMEYTPFYARE